MKNIFLISLFFLVIGCKMVDVHQPINLNVSLVHSKNYFNSTDIDYVFKGQIDVYGNQISTLLVVKKIDENKYRIAITNDFGNKLLDLSVENEGYKIIYVAKDLNKKIILNPIISDLLFLVKKSYICIQNLEKNNYIIARLNKDNFIRIELLDNYKFKYSFFKKSERLIKYFILEKKEEKLENILIFHEDIKLSLNYTSI